MGGGAYTVAVFVPVFCREIGGGVWTVVICDIDGLP